MVLDVLRKDRVEGVVQRGVQMVVVQNQRVGSEDLRERRGEERRGEERRGEERRGEERRGEERKGGRDVSRVKDIKRQLMSQ